MQQSIQETESYQKSKDVENYKKMKSKIQSAERQAYWQHIEKVIDPGDSGTRDKSEKQIRFWSFIKSLRKDNLEEEIKESINQSLKDREKMHVDPVDKGSLHNRQYKSVHTRDDAGDIPCLVGQPYPPMPDITVTKKERQLMDKI